MKPLALLPLLVFAACTSGVIPAGPNTYIITKQVSSFSSGVGVTLRAWSRSSCNRFVMIHPEENW